MHKNFFEFYSKFAKNICILLSAVKLQNVGSIAVSSHPIRHLRKMCVVCLVFTKINGIIGFPRRLIKL